MKKVLFFILVFCLSIPIFSQVKYGIKAGLNLSNLSGFDSDYSKYTLSLNGPYGIHFGGFANYSINSLLGFQPELVFSMQGAKYPGYVYVQPEIKGGISRYYYINLPLLLEIKPFRFPLSFLAGPQLGLCVNRSLYDGSYLNKTIIKNNNFDLGLDFGLQYRLTSHLSLGLRYNIGLLPSSKYEFDLTEIGGNKGIYNAGKNIVLQLTIAWTF